MVTIDINKQENIRFKLYPDNQPHVKIVDVREDSDVMVICSICSSLDLLHLLECSNALDNIFAKKKELRIPYLMGARFDRLMEYGDSIDLKVVADLINMCGFEKVYLWDVHSDTATILIKNSINVQNSILIKEYSQENSVLICPDAGAAKKVGKYIELNDCISDVVYCIKNRNLANGEITLRVFEPEKCEGRNCVIIDDLCDGGGTFLGIASQIKPSHLSLIVTHGVFSKGTKIFEPYFNEIICSDSYNHTPESNIVKVIKNPLSTWTNI